MFSSHTADRKSSAFMTSVHALSAVLSIIVTILFSPKFYAVTKNAVAVWLIESYGVSWIDVLMPLWAVLSALLIFFAIKIALSSLVMLGAASLAKHFL